MRMRVRLAAAIAVAAVAAALLLAGCGGGGTSGGGYSAPPAPPATSGTSGGAATAPASGTVKIVMKNFAFDKSTVTMKAGQKIAFDNQDSAPHNIKLNGQESGVINPGSSFTFTLAKAGTYPFSCIIHPQMTGTVTVQ